MIKEFFTKLIGLNPSRHEKWREDMAQRGQGISRMAQQHWEETARMKAMAEGRRQQALSNIPPVDLLRRQKEDLEVNTKIEKHDQAA